MTLRTDSARATFSRQISNGGKRVELGGVGGSRGVKGEVGCMGLRSPDGTNLLLLLIVIMIIITIITLMIIITGCIGLGAQMSLIYSSTAAAACFPIQLSTDPPLD